MGTAGGASAGAAGVGVVLKSPPPHPHRSDGHQLLEGLDTGAVLDVFVEEGPLLLPALEGRVEEEPLLLSVQEGRVGSTGAGVDPVSFRPSNFPCIQSEPPSFPSSRVQSSCHCLPEGAPCQDM